MTNLTEEQIKELQKQAEDEDEDVRSGVAKNPSTPVSLLEKLAEDKDEDVRMEVASNPSTPVSLLEKLAEDKHEDVRVEVAKNPSTPVSLLEKLAEDKDLSVSVRRNVAQNPSTPVSLLEKLAEDEHEYVRSGVAENPSTPVSLLEKLAEDEGEHVREEVAEEKIYEISGYGRECIIGTLSNKEADSIIDDEDIEEVLGDVHGNDNIIHVYGPDSDDLNITDKAGNKVEFNSIVFEIDIMSNYLDANDYLLDDIKDNFDGLSLSENFKISNFFSDIKSIYNKKPSAEKILMQQYVEEGYWGDISIPSNLSNENVLLVHLLCEENVPKTVEMLIGYIVYDNENIEFVNLVCDASTEGQSNELVIYDIKKEEILWEV